MELLSNVNVNFISKRHIAFVLSGLVIAAGILSLVWKSGPDMGIDFKGGVQLLLKYGIPISEDPGDDTANAVTISKTNQEVQGFKVGDTIKIYEGDKVLRAQIKSPPSPSNGTVKIEFIKPLGFNFTDAAVIEPIKPILTENIKTQLNQLGYGQATLTPSGKDEVLISAVQIEPSPVPLSADPGDDNSSSITIATSYVKAQVFQEGDRVVIEEKVEGGKIEKTREIKSVNTDGDTTTIEFDMPLEADFAAAATIRHTNVGRHIVSGLKRVEPNLKIVDENISEVGPNIGKDLQLAATVGRSISKDNIENIPKVISTS